MNIRFLYFEGCPSVDPALARLEAVVAQLAPAAGIEKVVVASLDEAREHGFYGSPSIQIDGRDLEHDPGRPSTMNCRLYGIKGVPPRWLIEAGVLRALKPKGLLFLCVANSARSQLGEGVARRLAPADVHVQSAGSRPTQLRPEAAELLAGMGADLTLHVAKDIDAIAPDTVDTVITLCAEEDCALYPAAARRLHWALPDPAAVEGDPQTRLAAFAEARDELHRRLSIIFADSDPTRRARDVREQVSSFYTRSIETVGGCCGGATLPKGVLANMAGYAPADLKALPPDAVENAFGCGDPLAFSAVGEGETVLDLGSGAGIDLIMAARKVGPAGRVIGVDMTDGMIERARANIAASGLENIEVRKGTIEDLPVESGSVDWVISNCVINLSPEKDRVFAEIHRVLKPGGRISISDIVAEEMPEFVRASADLYASCISGAVSEAVYIEGLRRSGLEDVKVTARLVYDADQLGSLVASEASGGCCGATGDLPDAFRDRAVAALDRKVASLKFSATRPVRRSP